MVASNGTFSSGITCRHLSITFMALSFFPSLIKTDASVPICIQIGNHKRINGGIKRNIFFGHYLQAFVNHLHGFVFLSLTNQNRCKCSHLYSDRKPQANKWWHQTEHFLRALPAGICQSPSWLCLSFPH